jgi:hypothetical protein
MHKSAHARLTYVDRDGFASLVASIVLDNRLFSFPAKLGILRA